MLSNTPVRNRLEVITNICAAIQFAARHPNRTHALLTECAVTGKLKHQKAETVKSNAMKFVATSSFTQRMAAYISREALAK